jgi:hypothetical protein
MGNVIGVSDVITTPHIPLGQSITFCVTCNDFVDIDTQGTLAPFVLNGSGDDDNTISNMVLNPSTLPSTNTVTMDANGMVTYTVVDPNFSGTESFTYTFDVDSGTDGIADSTNTVSAFPVVITVLEDVKMDQENKNEVSTKAALDMVSQVLGDQVLENLPGGPSKGLYDKYEKQVTGGPTTFLYYADPSKVQSNAEQSLAEFLCELPGSPNCPNN